MQKKHFIAIVTAVAAAFTLNAKATPAKGGKAPAWINTPAKVYPAEKYMYSVGNAGDRGSAELKAVQGLAAMFSQNIDSDTTAEKRLLQGMADGTVATASIASFDMKVTRTVSQSDLIGIEIPEYYQDEKHSVWYAIAVIDKGKVSALYEDMIKKNNESVQKLLSKVTDASLDSYAFCDYAADIARLNEGYMARLTVINSDAAARLQSSCKSSKDIKITLMEIAGKIPVRVSIENDEDGNIAAAFSDVITSHGFKTTKDSLSRYSFTGSVKFSESKTSDGTNVHCRYEITTYLKDNAKGTELFPFTLTGRDAHVDFAGAKIRAKKSIEKKIKSDFNSKFSGYLKQLSAD